MTAGFGPTGVAGMSRWTVRNPLAPLRAYARFTAVVGLDALLGANVRLAPLPRIERPTDSWTGLAATFSDTAVRYRLAFDSGDRLDGACVIAGLGRKPLVLPKGGNK